MCVCAPVRVCQKPPFMQASYAHRVRLRQSRIWPLLPAQQEVLNCELYYAVFCTVCNVSGRCEAQALGQEKATATPRTIAIAHCAHILVMIWYYFASCVLACWHSAASLAQ